MKFLIMETEGGDFRSQAIGWSWQDCAEATCLDFPKTHANIGRVKDWSEYSGELPRYEAPLYALSEGWRLMAPPSTNGEGFFEWWFTRE